VATGPGCRRQVHALESTAETQRTRGEEGVASGFIPDGILTAERRERREQPRYGFRVEAVALALAFLCDLGVLGG